jgi:hypothetical protein
MMTKWLNAARKKLGGEFPRPHAKREMEKYAEKMRQIKLKRGKKSIQAIQKEKEEEAGGREGWKKVELTKAAEALAHRWLNLARESLEIRFKLKSESLREDLHVTLSKMKEEDDWFFNADFRLQGVELRERADELIDDRKTLEAEATVKIRKVEADLIDTVGSKEEEADKRKFAFEKRIQEKNNEAMLAMEQRTQELLKMKAEKRRLFDEKEKKARMELGAAPTEMQQEHRGKLDELDNQLRDEQIRMEREREEEEEEARAMFDRQQSKLLQEITRRKATAQEAISRIRAELAQRLKEDESDWQAKTNKWLVVARKKVEAKELEDNEARAAKRKRTSRK